MLVNIRGCSADLSLWPRHLNFHIPKEKNQINFIPFSHTQERVKLLEPRVISILHGSKFLSQIKQVHAQIYRNGLDQSCYLLTKLVRRISELNLPMEPYPRLVFDQIHHPNSFLWTALIRGYALEGRLDESVGLYGRMRRTGNPPLSFTLTALLKSCGEKLENGGEKLGTQIHSQVVKFGGFGMDLVVGNALIYMYVKCSDFDCARKVFDEMTERDVVSGTSLISAYSKSGDVASAKDLFDVLSVKDTVAWTAMVNGYAQNAMPCEALEMFRIMQDDGVEVDGVTLVGVISACGQLGAAKYANWVLDVARKWGIEIYDDVYVGSALVDMYTKCGMLEDAYRIFSNMLERSVYTYSAMISGFAIHGYAKKSLECFNDMINAGIDPNEVTFMGVLSACSHAGMVEEGKGFFMNMEECYGVAPTAEHYICMVDLLGRSGHLKEALNVAKSMPLKDNAGAWGALLSACCNYGNPDIAEVAASHLFELEPDVRGNYILLSNAYAAAGRWDDVSCVKRFMQKKKSLVKSPGFSWIERDSGGIERFFAGDLRHPLSSEMMQLLEFLFGKLRSVGYEPKLSSLGYDVCEGDKQRILLTHSEKLALAYGLINSGDGVAIRIMKNLRICEDCHEFIAGVSRVMGRDVVVRDKIRFHHFSGGECSCGNFW